MTEPFSRTVSVSYDALIRRAVALGVLPEAGLTPREQCALLKQAQVWPPGDADQLVELVELLLYTRRGHQQAEDAAVSLCERLGQALPTAPPVTADTDVTRADSGLLGQRAQQSFSRLLMTGGRWVPVLATVLLVVAVGALVMTTDLGSLPSWFEGSSGSSTGGLGAELSEIKSAQGSWDREPSQVTMITQRVPRELSLNTWPPGFDGITGTDATFTNRVDPISPPLDFTHRLNVYPTVTDSFTFVRAVGELYEAPDELEGALYAFRVNVRVKLRRGVAVPIPSTAPDVAVLSWTSSPNVPLRMVKDEAGGLYAVGDANQTVRLRYTLASAVNYSFAPLPDVPFVPRYTEIPDAVRASGEQVLAVIGGLPARSYAETVRRLHAYFSGFSVCPLKPNEQRENDYLTIALARKGVCRHRARSFCITAAALGLPARLIENRIHSFAEVLLPNGTWRRLEFRLGDGEHPPVPRTQAAQAMGLWNPHETEPVHWSVYIAIAAVLLVFVQLVRGHRQVCLSHQASMGVDAGRPHDRAHRDHQEGWQGQAIARFTTVVRERLALHLGLQADDPEAMRRALVECDVPQEYRPRLAELLAQPRVGEEPASAGASEAQYAYWNCYHVLRWIDKERP